MATSCGTTVALSGCRPQSPKPPGGRRSSPPEEGAPAGTPPRRVRGLLVLAAVLTFGPTASRAGAPVAVPSQTRTYFVAADHVSWSYAPDGQNDITGQPFDDTAEVFTEPGPDRIGTAYTKSLYREYADASFKTLKPRPPEWQHLGLLGPVIHAVVGDKVRIVFKNHLDRPVSIHMHGLLYDKSSEGAPYNDGTTAAQHGDDAVPPGTVHTPHWHGNTVVANGMRTDVVSLLPAQMITADMTPDDPGIWLFHCHVNNHALAGMLTRYQVVA